MLLKLLYKSHNLYTVCETMCVSIPINNEAPAVTSILTFHPTESAAKYTL